MKLDRFEGVDFKCDNSFFKFRKLRKKNIFGPKFKLFLEKLYNLTNSSVLISNITKLFKLFTPKNTQIRQIWI